MLAPLIQLALSSARNATANATSSGRPSQSSSGVMLSKTCGRNGGTVRCSSCRNCGVLTMPGDTAFTVHPYFGGSSFAKMRVKVARAPFDVAYAACSSWGFVPTAEVIEMIRPPPPSLFLGKCGKAACVTRRAPRTLVFMVFSNSSAVVSSTGASCARPALCTMISSLPYILTAALTSAAGPSAVEMSASTANQSDLRDSPAFSASPSRCAKG